MSRAQFEQDGFVKGARRLEREQESTHQFDGGKCERCGGELNVHPALSYCSECSVELAPWWLKWLFKR